MQNLPFLYFFKRRYDRIACLFALIFYTACVSAGQLHLRGDSFLTGKIIRIQDAIVIIETAFAGTLEIETQQIKGINLDREVLVTLNSDERLLGRLRYSPEQGQQIISTLLGDISLTEGLSLIAIANVEEHGDKKDPVMEKNRDMPEEYKEEIENLKKEHERKITELKKRNESFRDPWSSSVSIGLNGAQGNTDRIGLNGRAEARRETNGDRLTLYTEGNLQRENNIAIANEVLAGATLQLDFTRKWFSFGGIDVEKDEFEDLELRAVANTGVGYFLARQEKLSWQALFGFGYQHETFDSGGVEEAGIFSLGYDFNYRHNEWLSFIHKLTYFASVRSSADDYRVVSNFGAQMPVGNTESWKLRLSLRNNYDSLPSAGIHKLDTTYSLNLLFDFD